MFVINLVNQAFLTAVHPIIAKDILERFQFSLLFQKLKYEMKTEAASYGRIVSPG